MERTYATIAGLTYSVLDTALRQIGYVRHEEPDQVIYSHPKEAKARLIYPSFRLDTEVRGIDLFATQKILSGFGLMEEPDFDLLLVRMTGRRVAGTAT